MLDAKLKKNIHDLASNLEPEVFQTVKDMVEVNVEPDSTAMAILSLAISMKRIADMQKASYDLVGLNKFEP